MEKLELKHIAPYLPYGLKIMHGDNIKKMNTGQGSSKYWIGIGSVINWQNTKAGCKPILHPLSDLTKEIEHNGERFVPLLELAKIESVTCKSVGDYGLQIEDGDELYYYVHYDDEFGSNVLYVNLESQSFLDCSRGSFSDSARNQLELFQKLFEWKFDLFHLIESGRAIDINTTTQ